MKVVWEFDPDNPEDKEKLHLYQKAGGMHRALWDFSQVLREKLKYADLSEDETKTYEYLRDSFFALLDENEIDLDI